MQTTPIPIGLIGSGKISAAFVAACRAENLFRPAAILSRTRAAGEAFAAANGIPAVYTDASAFFACGIRAVYIASPNYAHRAQTLAACAAGLSVLVEKPAALSRAEFDEMVAAAEAAGCLLMEGMRPLYDPFLPLLTEKLPRVGKLRQVTLSYCQYSSRYDAFRRGERPNAFRPDLGNAALMDIGVYPAALCVALFGAPCTVRSASVFLENGFEGCGEALLSYPTFTVTVRYSKITEGIAPSVFLGEDGALSLYGHLNAPSRLTFTPRGGAEEELPYTPPAQNMTCELRAFAEALALPPTARIARPGRAVTAATLSLLDRIRAESGIVFPPAP